DSRNDGYDFKKKEEYICRDDILLSNGKITVSGKPVRCTDNQSCTNNALLLFSVYGEGLNLGSPAILVQPLIDFTPSSLEMDSLLGNYTQKLAAANESNIAETMNYIKTTSPKLKNLSLKIESTIFRTPRLNDTADRKDCQLKCFAICPSFDLDQQAADQIAQKSANLSAKLAPLSDYASLSALIQNRTVARQEYLKQEDLATYYLDKFGAVNDSGAKAIYLGSQAVQRMSNKSVSDKLDRLKSLHSTIPEDIAGRNFTTSDSDISEYSGLAGEVESAAVVLLAQYNKTKNAKNLMNSLILVLESKDLDPVSLKSLEVIRNESDDLDARFRDGLTLSQSAALEKNYTDLSVRAQDLLKSESDTPATRVLLLFRGFARRVNTGIAQVADQTDVIPSSQVPNSPLLFLFSLLSLVAAVSFLVLVFLFLFASLRFPVPKTGQILAAAFIMLVFLLVGLCTFMFLFLGKTSTDATLPEFMGDFENSSSTAIVVDLRNASFSDAQAIQTCASLLSSSPKLVNKSKSTYTLTSTTCTVSNASAINQTIPAADCLDMIDAAPSSFVLAYSQTNLPPKFSVIYQTKAEIRSNLDYYESCPILGLFS
ncbi:MAG TPA: hypothetical protein VLD37_03265, partial [Candidatus Bilamarchaeum sp.]|nr:hypothetical protein [Candidatus Bilamarchaeum sp.]